MINPKNKNKKLKLNRKTLKHKKKNIKTNIDNTVQLTENLNIK